MGRQFVYVTETMLIAQFSMIHMATAATFIQAEHLVAVLRSTYGSIMVWCRCRISRLAVKKHTSQGNVIFGCEMPCESGTRKEVVAFVLALAGVVLVFVGLLVVLFALTATTASTLAVSNIDIGVEWTTGVVDIATGIISLIVVGTYLQGPIVASLAVTFQNDVDDTCRAFWRELG